MMVVEILLVDAVVVAVYSHVQNLLRAVLDGAALLGRRLVSKRVHNPLKVDQPKPTVAPVSPSGLRSISGGGLFMRSAVSLYR